MRSTTWGRASSRPCARQGEACRRRAQQQTVQRLSSTGGSADASSSSRRIPSGHRASSRTAPIPSGALGALNRVILNIGLFSEEWLLHFNALIGGKPITPIEIAVARKNSSYWQATEAQTPDMALFFLKTARRHTSLKDAPGGAAYLTTDQADARPRQGRLRGDLRALPFEQGAGAGAGDRHPTAAPAPAICECCKRLLGLDEDRRVQGADAGNRPGADFLDNNYLSTELRIPVTLLRDQRMQPAGDQRA